MKVVVAEISVFPFRHVPKTAIGREMCSTTPIWVIAGWIVIGMVAAKSWLIGDATTADIRTVGEITSICDTGAAEFAAMI